MNQKEHFLGYQANQELKNQDDLKQYLDFHVNNLGDPFVEGNFTVNSKVMEQAVLDYYANLWHAIPRDKNKNEKEQDPDAYWGYVLSMGATEGNLYGLWNARDYLGGKLLLQEKPGPWANGSSPVKPRLVYVQAEAPEDEPNAYTPIAFFSADTHYSIIKAMRVLGIQTFYEVGTEHYGTQCPINNGKWPQEVPSEGGELGHGSMDIDKLAKLVDFFAEKGYPIIVSFNYGTTFKGAYDDVAKACERLEPILKRHNLFERWVKYDKDKNLFDKRTGYWFHVDGALGAAYMPFVEMAQKRGELPGRRPNFDFRLPMVHSLSMSGHKWIGAPWPCGIYMTRVKMQIKPPDDPEYIGSPDTTFAGSRNGLSPMIFWNYLATHSYEEQIKKAIKTEELASYAEEKLNRLAQDPNNPRDLWVQRSPLSLTVLFKAASDEIVKKYSLSGETLIVKGQERHYSHIFLMESVTKELIDQLILDLGKDGGIPDQDLPPVGATSATFDDTTRPLISVPTIGRGFK
jgi:histidine decarboxylase